MDSKKIDVQAELVVKKSSDFRHVAYKASGNVSERDAIERNTIGSLGDNGNSEEEDAKLRGHSADS